MGFGFPSHWASPAPDAFTELGATQLHGIVLKQSELHIPSTSLGWVLKKDGPKRPYSSPPGWGTDTV